MKYVVMAVTMMFLSMGANASLISIPTGTSVIDTFDTTQQSIKDTTSGDGGVSSSTSSVGDDILGGHRDLYVEAFGPAVVDGDGSSIGVSSLGYLKFANDPGVSGLGRIQWDGGYADQVDGAIALDPTGLGGMDLTNGLMNTSIMLETISSDAAWAFEIFAYTDAENWTMLSLTANQVLSGTDPHMTYIPFVAFTNCAIVGDREGTMCDFSGGGVDWTNVGAIDVFLNTTGTADVDLRLGSATTVPEPSSMALLGLGLLGTMAVRRRKSTV